jgi:hypothetical protein
VILRQGRGLKGHRLNKPSAQHYRERKGSALDSKLIIDCGNEGGVIKEAVKGATCVQDKQGMRWQGSRLGAFAVACCPRSAIAHCKQTAISPV